jgi:hypothetical protein
LPRHDKYRISGFWDTPLDGILRNLDVRTMEGRTSPVSFVRRVRARFFAERIGPAGGRLVHDARYGIEPG